MICRLLEKYKEAEVLATNDIKKTPDVRSENPIESYHLIKRLTSTWSILNELTPQNRSKGNRVNSLSCINNLNN